MCLPRVQGNPDPPAALARRPGFPLALVSPVVWALSGRVFILLDNLSRDLAPFSGPAFTLSDLTLIRSADAEMGTKGAAGPAARHGRVADRTIGLRHDTNHGRIFPPTTHGLQSPLIHTMTVTRALGVYAVLLATSPAAAQAHRPSSRFSCRMLQLSPMFTSTARSGSRNE